MSADGSVTLCEGHANGLHIIARLPRPDALELAARIRASDRPIPHEVPGSAVVVAEPSRRPVRRYRPARLPLPQLRRIDPDPAA